MDRLSDHANASAGRSLDELLDSSRAHLGQIRSAARSNPFLNTRLASEICDRLHAAVVNADRLPAYSISWIKGAIAYFADSGDELADLSSPIGFEDDCEILNACLRLAGRDDLCLNPEDFDDH